MKERGTRTPPSKSASKQLKRVQSEIRCLIKQNQPDSKLSKIYNWISQLNDHNQNSQLINKVYVALENIFCKSRETEQSINDKYSFEKTLDKHDFINLIEQTFRLQLSIDHLYEKINQLQTLICDTTGIKEPSQMINDKVERSISSLEFIQ